jgi:hypothetical protein
MTRLQLLRASKEADEAWMAEVVAVFGARDADMARFQNRANGEPGTRLNDLYRAYVRTRDAYLSS